MLALGLPTPSSPFILAPNSQCQVCRALSTGDNRKTSQMQWATMRRMEPATLLKWVFPLQALKACEVPVCRAQPESLFGGECGEVGVGHEIRGALRVREKRYRSLLLAFRRHWSPDRLRCQPRLHPAQGGRHRNGSIEGTGIASDPRTPAEWSKEVTPERPR